MITNRTLALGAAAGLLAAAAASTARAQDAADEKKVDHFARVKPILEAACVHCHCESKQEGELRIDTKMYLEIGGDNGPSIVPGKPEESYFYELVALPEDDDDVMPPKKEGVLSKEQQLVIRDWIAAGAPFPEDAQLEVVPRIDFVKNVQPILEVNCLGCHSDERAEEKGADYSMSTKKAAFTTGDTAPYNIVPFDSYTSYLYELVSLDADEDELMPPKKSNGPLPKEEIEIIKHWIDQGAIWPDGVTLSQKERKVADSNTPDNMELVNKIHALIVEKSKETAEAEMKEYENTVPKTSALYTMVPIKGGEFTLGSPASEADRSEDEGPQVQVKIKPFWMGKYEVTWNEYEPFMITPIARNKDGSVQTILPTYGLPDLVSSPTTPYTEMSFGMGQDGYPAISMTQHAANKYCQWLSAQTGHFYRLPTEAEWNTPAA
ncbi:MAG: c-type cytochrome domain-containing protein [Verrucomicrobiales bacterium]